MHFGFSNLSILIALASGAASAVASPSAQEVWQRHLDGIGGVEACAVDSLHASGRYILAASGLEGTIDVYLQRPDKLLFRVEFPNGVTASGTDGVVAWRVEPQKPARLLGNDERRGLAKWLARGFSIAPDPDAVQGVGTADVVELDGRTALRATMEVLATGDTYTEFYDPETGLLLARVEPGPPGSGMELKGTPSDYREFDGLLVATTWEHELAGQAWSAAYEAVELNVEIDPEIFAPPPELGNGDGGPEPQKERAPPVQRGSRPGCGPGTGLGADTEQGRLKREP